MSIIKMNGSKKSKVNKAALLEKASELTAKGKLDKAIPLYKEVASYDSGDVGVRLKLAACYEKIRNKQEAYAVLLDVAQLYTKSGFYLKAQAVYKRIVALGMANDSIFLEMANLFYKLGYIKDGLLVCDKLIHSTSGQTKIQALELADKLDSVGFKYKLDLAVELYKAARVDASFEVYKAALSKNFKAYGEEKATEIASYFLKVVAYEARFVSFTLETLGGVRNKEILSFIKAGKAHAVKPQDKQFFSLMETSYNSAAVTATPVTVAPKTEHPVMPIPSVSVQAQPEQKQVVEEEEEVLALDSADELDRWTGKRPLASTRVEEEKVVPELELVAEEAVMPLADKEAAQWPQNDKWEDEWADEIEAEVEAIAATHKSKEEDDTIDISTLLEIEEDSMDQVKEDDWGELVFFKENDVDNFSTRVRAAINGVILARERKDYGAIFNITGTLLENMA